MALGHRNDPPPPELWIPHTAMPRAASHPFYTALNQLLATHGFDPFVEERCAPFYAPGMGRPSLAPGIYFRLLLIGYFEGIDSERGIAWRAADSLALRAFLGLGWTDAVPDHSTISRTRRRIDAETHRAVFLWVLERLGQAGLLEGKTLGVDATTLEANAALRSIVRRDTGETYEEFLTRLAKASGIATPTRGDLARLDRHRPKKGANADWEHPHDPEAQIMKMKDGRTHLAHKAEHAVDLTTGAVVAVTVQPATAGDTHTLAATLTTALEQLAAVAATPGTVGLGDEVVLDKGYHSRAVLVDLAAAGLRSYCSEPARGRQCWHGDRVAQTAVQANRRRIRSPRGQRLLRQRGEKLERPHAHLYETGGMRRVHLRGQDNILKRLLVHVAGFNLGLWMRQQYGVGKPRALQGLSVVLAWVRWVLAVLWPRLGDPFDHSKPHDVPSRRRDHYHMFAAAPSTSTTGC